MKMEFKTNITDVPSTIGIVTMWLSKIKLASKEVAKTDGQPRALHEEEEENQYWAVPEQGGEAR